MLEFIKSNYASILMVLLFVIGLLFLYKKGKKETVRKIILSLVVQAEKTLGSGTGELKYAMVVENIYRILPSIITMLLSEKELDNMIEDGVQFLKDYLASGKDLLSYDDEFIKEYNIQFPPDNALD